MAREDVVVVLRRNLESEQHTLEEVRNALRQALAVTPTRA
jgi:hypothetical protein